MKITVYNQEGKETGEMALPKEIFEVPLNADLVHQVLTAQSANMRQASAHTKNRGEVRGGGRKPWRQKGTGRARHGSIRSPLWRGGGVTFGPRNERVFGKEIPKKMRRKALCMVLSKKAQDKQLIVVDEMAMEVPKTKRMAQIIKSLPAGSGSRLVLYSNGAKGIFLSARNIPKTGVLEARNLNIIDLMNHKYVLTSKDGIKALEALLKK